MALVIMAEVYRVRVAADAAPGWDEALHLLRAELLATDLRQGHGWAFAYDVYRMSGWPPAHAVMVGVLFAVAGSSLVLGRAVSLAAFAVLAATLALLAHRLAPRPSGIAPASAIILTVTSWGVAAYAGVAMLEAVALALFAFTLLAFDHDVRRGGSRSSQALLAVASIGAYLGRINYGLPILAVLGFDALLEWRRAGWRETLRRRGVFLAIWIAFALVWFAHPQKWESTWGTLTSSAIGPPSGAPEGALFAPWALLEKIGWPLLVLALAALLGWRRWRGQRTLRFAALFFLLYLGLVAAHQNQLTRHIVPAVLPAVLLAAWTSAEIADRVLRLGSSRRMHAALGALLAILVAIRLGLGWRELQPWRQPNPLWREVPALIAELAAGQKFLLLAERWEGLSTPPAIDWVLAAEHRLIEPSRSGAIGEIRRGSEARRTVDALRRRGIVLSGLEDVLRRPTASDQPRTIYLGIPFRRFYGQTIEQVTASLESLHLTDYPTVILAVPERRLGTPIPVADLRPALVARGYTVDGARALHGIYFERFVRARGIEAVLNSPASSSPE